ncbi:MAG: alpha/beta hydrolase [Actinobacteria bacterium]|nr:alpha/beta hydrolase [Actinomycetota bacterium]
MAGEFLSAPVIHRGGARTGVTRGTRWLTVDDYAALCSEEPASALARHHRCRRHPRVADWWLGASVEQTLRSPDLDRIPQSDYPSSAARLALSSLAWRRHHEAVAEFVVTSDGERLAVDMAGEAAGASVLLCHALAGGRETWNGVSAELLAFGCQVVTFDQRGHGESSGPGTVTVERLANDVVEVVTQLGLEEVSLAGHSTGGYALLAIDPEFLDERARSITTLGTTARLESARTRAMLRWAGSPTAARLQATRWPGKMLVRRGAFGPDPTDEAIDMTWATAAQCLPETRRRYITALLEGSDLTNRVGAIPVPVTSIAGSRDRVTPPEHARMIAEIAADGRFVELTHVGHMIPVEAPTETATAIMASIERP